MSNDAVDSTADQNAASTIGGCGTTVLFIVIGFIALAFALGTAVTADDPDSTASALMWGLALGAAVAMGHATLIFASHRYRTAQTWIPSTGFVLCMSVSFSIWIERVTPSLRTSIYAGLAVFIMTLWPLEQLARRLRARLDSSC